MKAQSAFPLTLLFLTALGLSCGDFDDDFEFEHDRDREFGPGHKPGDRPTRDGSRCDAGTIVVVVQPPDAGVNVPSQDAAVEPDATEPLADAGVSCPEEGCACRRDNDCPSDQVCNHAIGRCEPPPVWCTDITVEAECVARADCQAIYGGMNCTDANGGECVSGDVDCTCEIFSFAACINHP